MAIRNAQLSKPIVYYFSNPAVYGGTGEIIMGLPEQFAAPAGFEKVVCTSTAAAEKWSNRMRVWEKAKEEIAEAYQRSQEEKQYRETLSDFNHKIANARNAVNRDFLVRAKENFIRRYEDRFKTERTSFLHLEAYDDGDKSVRTPKVRLPKHVFHGGIGELEE
jgi:hypothetical protein